MTKDKKRGLIDRLNSGPVICAEGFLLKSKKEAICLLENLFPWFR